MYVCSVNFFVSLKQAVNLFCTWLTYTISLCCMVYFLISLLWAWITWSTLQLVTAETHVPLKGDVPSKSMPFHTSCHFFSKCLVLRKKMKEEKISEKRSLGWFGFMNLSHVPCKQYAWYSNIQIKWLWFNRTIRRIAWFQFPYPQNLNEYIAFKFHRFCDKIMHIQI